MDQCRSPYAPGVNESYRAADPEKSSHCQEARITEHPKAVHHVQMVDQEDCERIAGREPNGSGPAPKQLLIARKRSHRTRFPVARPTFISIVLKFDLRAATARKLGAATAAAAAALVARRDQHGSEQRLLEHAGEHPRENEAPEEPKKPATGCHRYPSQRAKGVAKGHNAGTADKQVQRAQCQASEVWFP